jgi:hypothetical protein
LPDVGVEVDVAEVEEDEDLGVVVWEDDVGVVEPVLWTH